MKKLHSEKYAMVNQKNELEKLVLENGLEKLRSRKNKLENAFSKLGI